MRFSIITVTLNAERHLQKSLESAAGQLFSDYEHLIWDGGSSDRTLEIASQFSNVIIHQGKDHGIADAMNRGASLAKGDFLLFLHSDDLLVHPRVLSFVDTCLKQRPHIQWLYGLSNYVDEEGEVCGKDRYRPFSQKRLRRYNLISHPAAFVARALFESVGGFRNEWRYCMDYDLWLRLSQVVSPFHLPTPLASFRKHEKSLSINNPLGVADEAYRVRSSHLSHPWERFRSYQAWKKRRRKTLEQIGRHD